MSLSTEYRQYKYDPEFIYQGFILDIQFQLNAIIKKKGLKKKEVAKKAGISTTYLSRILNGWVAPSVKTLAKLFSAVEVSPVLVFKYLQQ